MTPLTPEDAEREYSPSSCIGGVWEPYIDQYLTEGAAARQAAAGRWQRVQVGAAPLPALELCLPTAAAGPVPLLLFIHGGYWQALGAEHGLFPATRCLQRGWAFASLDYSLAPGATLPAIVAECRAAWAWLEANAARLGLDLVRSTLAGHSAGAHLAALVAHGAAQRPAGLLLLSGVYWLAPLVGTSINQALGLTEKQAQAFSPGALPLQGMPPALLAWGEVETAAFKQQSRAFAAALRAAGTPARTQEVAGRNHFDLPFELAALAPESWP